MQRTRRNGIVAFLPVAIIILVILIDQITKCFFHGKGSTYSQEVINGFLTFKTVYNDGAAFSFLGDVPWAQTFFKILTLVSIVIFYVFYLYALKKEYVFLQYSLALIFAGMLGNFIDRLAFSYVVDFISCNFWGYDFAVFNVADMSLCVGVAMLLFHYLFLDSQALFKKNDK